MPFPSGFLSSQGLAALFHSAPHVQHNALALLRAAGQSRMDVISRVVQLHPLLTLHPCFCCLLLLPPQLPGRQQRGISQHRPVGTRGTTATGREKTPPTIKPRNVLVLNPPLLGSVNVGREHVLVYEKQGEAEGQAAAPPLQLGLYNQGQTVVLQHEQIY